MKVGFTGTRNGMTGTQMEAVRKTLEGLELPRRRRLVELHHGDCVGADHEAARVATALGMRIVQHPPLDWGMRASYPKLIESLKANNNFAVREAKPTLERNKDIVNETELLIAAPDSEERTRSGTWATVRYARKMGRAIIIVNPYGEISREQHERTLHATDQD